MAPERFRHFTRRAVICGSLLLTAGGSAFAQMHLTFSGYGVTIPTVQRVNETLAGLFGVEQQQVLDITRARLRPTLELWEGAKIALEHEVVLQYRSTPGLAFDAPATLQRQLISLHWEPFAGEHWSTQHFVDRLYFRQNTGSSSLIIGRQRIQWGTGRVWNPTDLFNPVNPVNYAKLEKDGADAVSFTAYLGNFTDLELVYNPEDHFRQWNAGTRFRTNVEGYDISFVGGYFDKQGIVGGDFAGNIFTAGVRGEAIHRFGNTRRGPVYTRWIFGVDYQFTGTLYGLIEYQHNGEGSTDRMSYSLLRLFRGEVLNVGQNYVALSATIQAHPLVSAGVTVTTNVDDRSVYVLPTAQYSYSDAITISAGGVLTAGSEMSEFWYYPTSIYLQCQMFF